MSYERLAEVRYNIVPGNFNAVDFIYHPESKMYSVFHLQVWYTMPEYLAANLNKWAEEEKQNTNRHYVSISDWYGQLNDQLRADVIRFDNEKQQYF